MPIKRTPENGKVTHEHVGRVLSVSTFDSYRNCSDTLDYTDFRTVSCTVALVYLGRTLPTEVAGEFGLWMATTRRLVKAGDALELQERFLQVDCTNLFGWRGQDTLHPSVDFDHLTLSLSTEAVEDIEAYAALCVAEALGGWARRVTCTMERRVAVDLHLAEEARNAPVVGKRMVVRSGRKVTPGTQGTVAYLREGRALLKPHDRWQDRSVDGVWVEARHLVAV